MWDKAADSGYSELRQKKKKTWVRYWEGDGLSGVNSWWPLLGKTDLSQTGGRGWPLPSPPPPSPTTKLHPSHSQAPAVDDTQIKLELRVVKVHTHTHSLSLSLSLAVFINVIISAPWTSQRKTSRVRFCCLWSVASLCSPEFQILLPCLIEPLIIKAPLVSTPLWCTQRYTGVAVFPFPAWSSLGAGRPLLPSLRLRPGLKANCGQVESSGCPDLCSLF